MPSYQPDDNPRTSFSVIHRSMMQADELSLQSIISEQRIADILDEHNVHFGEDPDAVYTPAITLWGLLSQVLFKEERRSCAAAVVRIAALWLSMGRVISSANTGDYCRARLQMPHDALRQISREIAERVIDGEAGDLPADQKSELADAGIGPAAEYRGGRMVMVDGFTVTAADTEANQEDYPQNPQQKEGLGFPILRGVVLIDMRSGLLLDAETGPYSGKGTGETALLWKLLDVLKAGDILVADSYYCTYWLLAACRRRGVHVVMRNHHLRDDAPADAKRLVKGQCVATWQRPDRPDWMDKETYQQMPQSIDVRLVESHNDQPGQRTEKLTIATTLLDHRLYNDRWLAGVYRGRWRVELDIRSIKVTLGMDILRAKSPEMVRTELWSCLLLYNLIRKSMLTAALQCARSCRALSFTSTLQMIGELWLINAVHGVSDSIRELFQSHQQSTKVGHRPGRNEPRANKRRPKVLALLTQPRHEARAALSSA